jgi:hypothetical protein
VVRLFFGGEPRVVGRARCRFGVSSPWEACEVVVVRCADVESKLCLVEYVGVMGLIVDCAAGSTFRVPSLLSKRNYDQ